MKKISILLLSVLTLVGCNRNRIPELTEEEQNQIVADARVLLSKYTEQADIPENEWPNSFIKFEPVIVKHSYSGIVIIRYKFVSHESGFMIPKKKGMVLESDQSVGYEKISNDLYYYWIPNEH
ncbi:hypothetical protein QEH52_19810 [Coraliomargarita sp. SDUM461003]|uniref:Lipoprotein n=1 Tax=Thalassobacterium maritimum TaxID=3041265 RepID=A0ABU1B037_9BACT|nr:hypothetical protein [Coraliomargarita sp. SDUM461003]MDQ8209775.1 hypothetical protein [Coraliomargarita sp. SDUM461003]